MCLVIDTNCVAIVFDGRNKKHKGFIPVLNWINCRGCMIYGGTKYNTELSGMPQYLPYIAELSRRRRTLQIADKKVDLIALRLKKRYPESIFDDEHILALVIASRCAVVCTDDNVAISYLKRSEIFKPEGLSIPSIFRGRKSHRKLCCDKYLVSSCKNRPN